MAAGNATTVPLVYFADDKSATAFERKFADPARRGLTTADVAELFGNLGEYLAQLFSNEDDQFAERHPVATSYRTSITKFRSFLTGVGLRKVSHWDLSFILELVNQLLAALRSTMADPTFVSQDQVLTKVAAIFDVSFPEQEKLLAAYQLRNPSPTSTREGKDNPTRTTGSAPYPNPSYQRDSSWTDRRFGAAGSATGIGSGGGGGGASSYGSGHRRDDLRSTYAPPLERRGRTAASSPSEGKASRHSTSPTDRGEDRPCI